MDHHNSSTLFFGRQPIVDSKSNLIGYELLFIDSASLVVEPKGFKQTAKLITSTLNLEGLDRVVGHTKAFVMIDEDFLMHDMILSVPIESFVFVMSSLTDYDTVVLKRLEELIKLGYHFGVELDADIIEDMSRIEVLLPFVDYCRISMDTVNSIGRKNTLAALAGLDKKILIKHVDKKEELEAFSSLDNCFFQGYFFLNSEMIQPELSNVEADGIISLCNMLSLEKSTEEIIEGFNKTPSMSIQLLQYLNSSAFHIKVPVKNIEKLLVLMGRETLRRWLLLTLYSVSADGAKPNPLLHMVTSRIDLLIELEFIINPEASKECLSKINFLGLLSLIDIVLHIPMEQIFEKLSIDDEIKDAILYQKGPLGELLAFSIAIEKFDILPVQEFITRHKLSPKAFEGHLVRSIENANTLIID